MDFDRADDGLLCVVVGDASLYEASTVCRWAALLGTLLAGLARTPDVAVDDVPLFTDFELAEPRALAGPASSEFPQVGLHHLIATQAARTPDLMAVVDDGQALSYRTLVERAARIAGTLRAAGVGPDVPVGVLLHRGVDLLAGLLGILWAGGAFVPMEADTPVRRLAALLLDARCQVVLVAPELADQVVAAGGAPLLVADAVAGEPAPAASVSPANLCAIYYTSGSTGRPKGVACTHGGWVNRMWWMRRRHCLRPGETVLHKTTLTFDDAAVELFWPLLVGGRVAMLSPGLQRDPQAIIDAARRYDTVHLNVVPSMLELVLDSLSVDGAARLPALRSVLSSGDVLRPALVRRFFARFGEQVSLDNTWGATEVSIDSTCHHCQNTDGHASGGSVSLGRPIDNNDVVVLDGLGRPLPVGVAGELCIGGVGLARGYVNDAARTAAAFVPHPYRPGERLYRTGDRGRRQPDGSLRFLDRRDHQVKIRGVRIELGEVESALRNHADVTDAVVVAWQATPVDKRLAAYVVPATGQHLSTSQLRRFLTERLSSYAVPGSITVLPALPRLASGKVDRRRLPEPDPETTRETEYRAPTTTAEQTVARIWADVLGLARVGVDDNFFALGGHSLLAVRIIARMRQGFGLDLALSLMFERPTVAAMAAWVEQLVLVEVAALTEEQARSLVTSNCGVPVFAVEASNIDGHI